MGGFSARVKGTGKGGMGRGWKGISFSICFLKPEGFLRLQRGRDGEHYLSDSINALRNCKTVVYSVVVCVCSVCECMQCVQCHLGRWLFEGDKERGLRGHAKERMLLATEEYTSYTSNVMMCGML